MRYALALKRIWSFQRQASARGVTCQPDGCRLRCLRRRCQRRSGRPDTTWEVSESRSRAFLGLGTGAHRTAWSRMLTMQSGAPESDLPTVSSLDTARSWRGAGRGVKLT